MGCSRAHLEGWCVKGLIAGDGCLRAGDSGSGV